METIKNPEKTRGVLITRKCFLGNQTERRKIKRGNVYLQRKVQNLEEGSCWSLKEDPKLKLYHRLGFGAVLGSSLFLLLLFAIFETLEENFEKETKTRGRIGSKRVVWSF